MSDVTQILAQIDSGNPQAAEQLLPLVYDKLRKLAAAKLAQEKSGQTLQATALVHEAYVRLLGDDGDEKWDSRGHFFAAAAEAMRRILIERARQRASLKRGGQMEREPLNDIAVDEVSGAEEMLALDESLAKLAQVDPQAAEFVKLRYFAGLTTDDAAKALGISPRTAYYIWDYARSWLRQEMRGACSDG